MLAPPAIGGESWGVGVGGARQQPRRALGLGCAFHMVKGGVLRACAPGCASRPHEGGRAASEVDHHARPLAARTRAGGTGRARAERTGGTFRRDFSKGLFKRVAIFSNEDKHGQKRASRKRKTVSRTCFSLAHVEKYRTPAQLAWPACGSMGVGATPRAKWAAAVAR
eukprot:scaffold39874_cov66-Phaeocystis_antarctica.AAC.2